MPKIKTTRTKRPPEGFEEIEAILDDYAKKMRDAENESHEGKRKAESLWPIMRISHTRSRYIYELYYKREAISRELYDWLLKEGYADANLVAKWKKSGYEKLCCLRCIQTKDMNYQGSTCVCRVPKAQLRAGTIVECVHCANFPASKVPTLLWRSDRNVAWRGSVMGLLAEQVVHVARSLTARAAAPQQAGVLSGANPAAWDAADPIKLWVIQVIIITGMTQILALIFGRIRQPRVIAEVIGGVILGPSIMGRIPGFSKTIFNTNSMPLLTLTGNIGLVFFLFLIGLEIDVRLVKKNARVSAAVSLAGLLVPLGLGAALGVGVYREFTNHTVNFGYFILFVAVAVGITAFPVLCRILTELKLLDTPVGAIVLAAGVGNDVVGWILLALTVALVNASTGLTALYVLLASAGFVLFLLFPIKWAYLALAKRTGSLEQGSPTTTMMTITLIMTLFSAFFTDIIGVHAIFGGFLAGLVIPHENGYAISMVEKMEDFVAILFLPIYFTLSGLRTNLGLLNDGITWGYIVIICCVAFFSKFIACGLTAYAAGMSWRESGAIGSLMSCKGLVELIVLNVGYTAGILDQRTFSMFVLHAIILTVMTTPLTIFFYPEHAQTHEGSYRTPVKTDAESPRSAPADEQLKTRFSIVLEKIEQLPAAMAISQLLQPAAHSPPSYVSSVAEEKAVEAHGISPIPGANVSIDALRLIELTNRTSAVLRSQESDHLLHNDPILSIFRTFGTLNRLSVSAALSVVNYDEFPDAIAQHARNADSQMVILPWARGATYEEDGAKNPFDGVFNRSGSQDQTSSVVYSEFIRKAFLHSPTDVALFVDRGLSSGAPGDHFLLLPFLGGPDDRLALSFLVQLCANSNVQGKVVWISKMEGGSFVAGGEATHATMAAADTVYGPHTTQTRIVSDTADNVLWERFSASPRLIFSKESSPRPLARIAELVQAEIAVRSNAIVLLGRSRRMAVESHAAELQALTSSKGAVVGSSVAKTLGDVGAALVASGTSASLLVLQAAVASN
ncbi:unnamed protein product [Mycena citricolor]|uniref:Cation/H+ exchanger transmembrane domain-containing protein n=2 Tax=Mycena citricolor TaxID=2018698 RepID=A0AAD2GSH9_9AGAR|nr:unnamed protein product [Mycena citricolor]